MIDDNDDPCQKVIRIMSVRISGDEYHLEEKAALIDFMLRCKFSQTYASGVSGLHRMCYHLGYMYFGSQKIIYSTHEQIDKLYLVVKGSVMLFRKRQDKELECEERRDLLNKRKLFHNQQQDLQNIYSEDFQLLNNQPELSNQARPISQITVFDHFGYYLPEGGQSFNPQFQSDHSALAGENTHILTLKSKVFSVNQSINNILNCKFLSSILHLEYHLLLDVISEVAFPNQDMLICTTNNNSPFIYCVLYGFAFCGKTIHPNKVRYFGQGDLFGQTLNKQKSFKQHIMELENSNDHPFRTTLNGIKIGKICDHKEMKTTPEKELNWIIVSGSKHTVVLKINLQMLNLVLRSAHVPIIEHARMTIPRIMQTFPDNFHNPPHIQQNKSDGFINQLIQREKLNQVQIKRSTSKQSTRDVKRQQAIQDNCFDKKYHSSSKSEFRSSSVPKVIEQFHIENIQKESAQNEIQIMDPEAKSTRICSYPWISDKIIKQEKKMVTKACNYDGNLDSQFNYTESDFFLSSQKSVNKQIKPRSLTDFSGKFLKINNIQFKTTNTSFKNIKKTHAQPVRYLEILLQTTARLKSEEMASNEINFTENARQYFNNIPISAPLFKKKNESIEPNITSATNQAASNTDLCKRKLIERQLSSTQMREQKRQEHNLKQAIKMVPDFQKTRQISTPRRRIVSSFNSTYTPFQNSYIQQINLQNNLTNKQLILSQLMLHKNKKNPLLNELIQFQ